VYRKRLQIGGVMLLMGSVITGAFNLRAVGGQATVKVNCHDR
jgi:hypothetical protein